MKLNFIPNWNGHLYLQQHTDKSITQLYNNTKFENKTLLKIEKNNIQNTNQTIQKHIEKNQNQFQLSITGDHSNTYPIIKTLAKQNPNLNLIIFDAHPDVEIGTDSVSHEDYVRFLIEENIIKPQNIHIFGLRTFSRTEYEYLKQKQINFQTITDILNNLENTKKLLSQIKGKTYLSIDIDVLDPDHAPATYYQEYCGLYINELKQLIQTILPQTISADITEYYNEKEDQNQTTQKNIQTLIQTITTAKK